MAVMTAPIAGMMIPIMAPVLRPPDFVSAGALPVCVAVGPPVVPCPSKFVSNSVSAFDDKSLTSYGLRH